MSRPHLFAFLAHSQTAKQQHRASWVPPTRCSQPLKRERAEEVGSKSSYWRNCGLRPQLDCWAASCEVPAFFGPQQPPLSCKDALGGPMGLQQGT